MKDGQQGKLYGPPQRPSVDDFHRLPYPKIRDRFLSSLDEADEVEWLIEVGSFVRDRWLAEEASRPAGEELDEHELWDVWDDCSEGHLRELRVKALIQLQSYLNAGRVRAVVLKIRKAIRPLESLLSAGAWLAWEVWRGFVGGVGLLILGLLFVWAEPHVAKSVRKTMDEVLPVATQPNSEGR